MPREGLGLSGRDVPVYDRNHRGAPAALTRIGGGGLGGKASSLALVLDEILPALDEAARGGFELFVPTATVLGTDLFDQFVAHNDLSRLLRSGEPDDRIAHAFQRGELPPLVVGDLRTLGQRLHTPLAVRSSSLLEDDLHHPFAGVYATKMIPNHQPEPDTRFRRLVEAIKFVWASTWFRAAQRYIERVGRNPRDEKMAVILQEVVGTRRGDRFYPTLSGVARSYNYYPMGRARPEDGVVNLALGLGKTIVDGGISWTYTPAYPKKPMPYGGPRDLIKNTQNRFWAVNMGRPPTPDPVREDEYLLHPGLREAEYDDVLKYVASTFVAGQGTVVPGIGNPGPRVLDFAPLRLFRDVPLNDVVRRLLARCEEVVGTAVEIEFAADLHPKRGLPARLGFLQVRPMAVADGTVEIDDELMRGPGVVLASDAALGHGELADIEDVVLVRPDRFDPAATREIAAEIEGLDVALRHAGRPYLLIGFGRWGSSDPWLGIPVDYGQIQGARVIVEATLPNMQPDPSQGSHFFQNLIAFHVLYLSVRDRTRIDFAWLMDQPAVAETAHVRHLRTPAPLRVLADGRTGRGIVIHDD